MLRRRPLLLGLPAWLAAPGAHALEPRTLLFPRDHAAHPELRTEWWYITGEARAGERRFGFQVTFFRSRVDAARTLSSRFAARQLVFAHAAVTDVDGRRLLHDQRIAREGFGIAQAATGEPRIALRDWSLVRTAEAWQARIPAQGFGLDLRCQATQPLLLQGRQGLSRKGPDPAQASYYYSEPQLAVQGRIAIAGRSMDIAGVAWMDHEWSEELLHPQAVGWDWIGMNLHDGSALTAFRLRTASGGTVWDGGSFRAKGGDTYAFSRGEVVFTPVRTWTSPTTQARYPVEWQVRTPADVYTVRAVLDDQELDSRASTGAIYWEGLCDLVDSNGKSVGRGYLEMTGYARRLRL